MLLMFRHSNARGCNDGLEAHHDEQSHQNVMTAREDRPECFIAAHKQSSSVVSDVILLKC